MDVLGELTQMLWLRVGEASAHIPATIFRAFTLKCQQLVLVPEFPVICIHEEAVFPLIKLYFDICVKYAWRQEKLNSLWKILLTNVQTEQIEAFKVPISVQKLTLAAKTLSKKAFSGFFKVPITTEYTELSFFTEMRTMLKQCDAEMKAVDKAAELEFQASNVIKLGQMDEHINEYAKSALLQY